jgi:transposase
MARPKKYPDALVARGVRLALESAVRSRMSLRISECTRRRRARRCAKPQADSGARPDLPSSQEREEIRALRREVFELRRANEILKSASVFSRTSSTQTGRGELLHRSAPRPSERLLLVQTTVTPSRGHCRSCLVGIATISTAVRSEARVRRRRAYAVDAWVGPSGASVVVPSARLLGGRAHRPLWTTSERVG